MLSEMSFACQFLTLPTQFSEPRCRAKRIEVDRR
jgi:translation initiation factor 2 beta subunit (eIF-2beta)/eIF-5